MFGQPGPIQIDTSATPGSLIKDPPTSYTTIFWAVVAGVKTLHCKENNAGVIAVHVITAGGSPVICEPPIG